MDSPARKPHFIPRNGGRKPFIPSPTDRNTVRNMAACGFTRAQIARCVGDYGVDEKTLRKHFARDLETAALMANATVGSKLFEKAKAGDLGSMVFWLKARGGWKETQAHEISGPGGAAIATTTVPASERLARRVAAIAARLGTPPGLPEPR